MSSSAETGERGAARTPARVYAAGLARDLPPLAVLAALLAEPSTRDFAAANVVVQAVLFAFVGCLPAYRTGVMAFADCAWPWGIVAIGVQALLFGDGGSTVLAIVAGIYLLVGLRMGVGAVVTIAADPPRDDLPRYRYRRLVWRREGYASDLFPMLHEIAQQGLANVSLLAAPAMLAVADRDASVGPVVIAGAVLWAVSWVLESVADVQKLRFVTRCARAGVSRTCDVGLWRYSRHPNYFFEWLVWLGVILVVLPSLVRLADDFALLPWLGFAVALVAIAGGMYYVLVHATGAVPAEHFSVQHRPGYRDYQRTVNRFFPGPRRREGRTAPAP